MTPDDDLNTMIAEATYAAERFCESLCILCHCRMGAHATIPSGHLVCPEPGARWQTVLSRREEPLQPRLVMAHTDAFCTCWPDRPPDRSFIACDTLRDLPSNAPLRRHVHCSNCGGRVG